MSFMQAIVSAFNNYAVFRGRSRRREYWFFFLFNVLVLLSVWAIGFITSVLLQNYAIMSVSYVLLAGYSFIIIIPILSVTCRRLHDTGQSGVFTLLMLIPMIGNIFLMIWAMKDGEPRKNQYGPDPKKRDVIPEMFGFAESPVITTPPPKDSFYPERNKHCISCGFDNDPSAIYCARCGSKLEISQSSEVDYILCSFCKRKIDNNAVFCPYCGEKNDRVRIKESESQTIDSNGLFVPSELD